MIKKLTTLVIIFAMAFTIMPMVSQPISAAVKKPAKVVLTSVKSTDYNAIKLTWKKANYAKKYQVYRALSQNGKYKLIKTTTAKSFTNKGLTTGKKYYYKVRAINGSKKGNFSYKKYAIPKLKQVAGIETARNGDYSIFVMWNKVNGAKGYQIYRSENKDGPYTKVESVRTNEFEDTNVIEGEGWYYKVRAYRTVNNKYKYGTYSKIAYGEIPEEQDLPEVQPEPVTPETPEAPESEEEIENDNSNTDDNTGELELETVRTEMLKIINAEREAAGLAPVKKYDPINKTAQIKAEDMYKTGILNHYSENLGYFYNQYDAAKISYAAGGENILQGAHSIESAMEWWMESEKHRENILRKECTHVGIGYCNGYWVQQFAKNPWGGHSIDCEQGAQVTCTKCGSLNTVTEYKMYSEDGEGNSYGIFNCSNCNNSIAKCPKCDTGTFEKAGITDYNSTAYKCNSCGNNKQETCYINCQFCGDELLRNSSEVEYRLTFDSTGTYDGKTYDKQDGCYFQSVSFTLIECKSCEKIVVTCERECRDYIEFYNNLEDTIKEGENIFNYIYWEKLIGKEVTGTSGNLTFYRELYEFRTTPEINSLNELIGTKAL